MLHVLLLILKIIGITLLVILGLVILIILLLLFVPVRYSGDGRFKRLEDEDDRSDPSDGGGEKDLPQQEDTSENAGVAGFDLYALAKITWLLHFISFTFNYSGDMGYRLKILGISVIREGNQKKQPKKKKKDERQETESQEAESQGTEGQAIESQGTEGQAIESQGTEDQAIESQTPENATDGSAETEGKSGEGKTEEENGGSDKKPDETAKGKKDKRGKKSGKKDKTGDSNAGTDAGEESGKKQSVVEKIKNVYNKFTAIRDDKKVQRAYEIVKTRVVKLLKAICPRKLGGYAKYGFEDPAVTGYITAFLASQYSRVRDLDIEPHFEDEILEGELKFKGRIFLITIVCIALKFLLNKDIKYTIAKLKEFKEEVQS